MQELKEVAISEAKTAEQSLKNILEGFDKFSTNYNNITLDVPLSAHQFAELNAGIEEYLQAWESTTFEDFLSYHSAKFAKDVADEKPKEDSPEAQWEVFLSQVENEYQTYLEDKPLWKLLIDEKLDETPELIDFIITQLQNKRLGFLELNQIYSDDSIDRIFQARVQSSLQTLYMPEEQVVLDYQVKKLLQDQNGRVCRLNGISLSDEIADRCVEAKISINNNAYFTKRYEIKYLVDDAPDIRMVHAELVKPSEIIRFTEQFTLFPRWPMGLTLNSNYVTPEWAQFFTKVLGEPALIKELNIERTTSFNGETFSALIRGIYTNNSIGSVILHIEDQEMLSRVLLALSTHSGLVKLHVYSSCIMQGDAFKELLSKTKTLRSLNLNNIERGRVVDEDTMLGLASGLKQNKSLTELYCNDTLPRLSPASLQAFGEALSSNRSLIRFSCNTRGESNKAIYAFSVSLKRNTSLIHFHTDIADENKLAFPNAILQRNRHYRSIDRQDCIKNLVFLFHLRRIKHKDVSPSYIFFNLLDFLRPSLQEASSEAGKRCMDLIASNVATRKRKWEKTALSKRGFRITIFAPQKKLEEVKYEKKIEECQEQAKKRLESFMNGNTEPSPLPESKKCVVS